jgi:oligopeptide/dipeptide ABC transporter ATP-binding protein
MTDLVADPRAVAVPVEGAALLEVRNLVVAFPSLRGTVYAVNGASFEVARGRTLGLVGESGSGKSVTLRALIGLVPPPGWIVRGEVLFDGHDLIQAPRQLLQAVRGRDIAMIFQDPMASLNPVLSIGDQLSETLRAKAGLTRRAAESRAEELLQRVGIRPPRARLHAYAHQMSGGMAQRVMIALAIAANPRLLLADEPTTALDVSVQDQILSLLEDLRLETGMSMLIVSHDLGVIARACDDVAVMYASRLLERGTVDEVLREPRHPYTRMLLATIPGLRPNMERRPLATISGQLPDLVDAAQGCPFAPRCGFAQPECATVPMTLDAPGRSHGSACPFV